MSWKEQLIHIEYCAAFFFSQIENILQCKPFAFISQIGHLHPAIIVLFWKKKVVIAESDPLNQHPFASSSRFPETTQTTAHQTYTNAKTNQIMFVCGVTLKVYIHTGQAEK